MRALLSFIRPHIAALRMLLIFTVLLGIGYPFLVTLIAQIPGLQSRADGSLVKANGTVVGSSSLAQSFTDKNGNPLPQYFQSRPSAGGFDPTATGASNLGPESIVDTLPNPAVKGDTGKQSLLTQVCSRSLMIGKVYGVDPARPFCTSTGVGAVLAVFWSGPGYHGQIIRVVSLNQPCPIKPFLATFHGVPVQCARFGVNYAKGQVVPIRGNAPAHPAIPPDAVTASGSGLDPNISPRYAQLQERVVAKTRGITVSQVAAQVAKFTNGRDLGFLGQPRVNVLRLNLALDRLYPIHGG
jgi:K+-transporting ATPase ATPase C chain